MGRRKPTQWGAYNLTKLLRQIFDGAIVGDESVSVALHRAEERIAEALQCCDPRATLREVERALADARQHLTRAQKHRAELGCPGARNGSPTNQGQAIAWTAQYMDHCARTVSERSRRERADGEPGGSRAMRRRP